MSRRQPTFTARHLLRLLLLLLLSPLVMTAGYTPAQAATGDWPMYLYNIHRTSGNLDETTLNVNNASQLAKIWVFTTTDPTKGIDSGPAVVGNDVYFGAGDGYEYALDASAHKLLWQTYLGVDIGQHVGISCTGQLGVTSSAAVQNGVLYVGGNDSTPGGRGVYFYALNATTGQVLWRAPSRDELRPGQWLLYLVQPAAVQRVRLHWPGQQLRYSPRARGTAANQPDH